VKGALYGFATVYLTTPFEIDVRQEYPAYAQLLRNDICHAIENINKLLPGIDNCQS